MILSKEQLTLALQDPKAFLGKAVWIPDQIRSEYAQVANLENNVEYSILELDELREERDVKTQELKTLYKGIAELIDLCVKTENRKLVMIHRFILGQEIDVIVEELHFAHRWTQELLTRGLTEFKDSLSVRLSSM